MPKTRIYLDNNAETRECAASLAKRDEFARGPLIGNASAGQHEEGRRAKRVLEAARAAIERECDAPRQGLMIFTSGATESNRLAIAAGLRDGAARRVAMTPFEHPSVARVAEQFDPLYVALESGGTGEIDLANLRDVCTEPDVGLVTLILAHNELGIVQPIEGLRDAVRAARRDRESDLLPVFHVDATQLLGKARFSFAASGADLASWSAHKFGGPGGVGGLLCASEGALACAETPEAQERGVRAGTEDVVGAACAAAALASANDLGGRGGGWDRARRACDAIAVAVTTRCPRMIANAWPSMRTLNPGSARLCNTVHVSCIGEGVTGHAAAKRLDREFGIAVATGSACSRSAPSVALAAAGFAARRVQGALRLSFPPALREEADVEPIVEALAAL